MPSVYGVADFVLVVRYLGNRNIRGEGGHEGTVLALVSKVSNPVLFPLNISELGSMFMENNCEQGAGRYHMYWSGGERTHDQGRLLQMLSFTVTIYWKIC